MGLTAFPPSTNHRRNAQFKTKLKNKIFYDLCACVYMYLDLRILMENRSERDERLLLRPFSADSADSADSARSAPEQRTEICVIDRL